MMRTAVINVGGEILARAAQVLADHGLKFVGTLSASVSNPKEVDMLRLIVKDEAGTILPEECESGWWLVRPTFTQESYGSQMLTKLSAIELIGAIEFGAGGEVKPIAKAA